MTAALEKAARWTTCEGVTWFAHSKWLKWRSLHVGETGEVLVNSAEWDPYVDVLNTSRAMDAI